MILVTLGTQDKEFTRLLKEIDRLIEYVSKEQVAKYDNTITEMPDNHMAGANSSKEEYDDPLYDEIVEFVVKTGKASASLLQRRFKLGYNRAARCIDLLETGSKRCL